MKKEKALDILKDFTYKNSFSASLILTKKCNLRCENCNVIEWLTNKVEDEQYDPIDLCNFVSKMEKSNHHFSLIGGEVTIVSDRIKKVIECINKNLSNVKFSMVSNLVDIPEDIDFMKKIQNIIISINGLPKDHDKERGNGTFKKTYKNIKRLIDKKVPVFIQCTMPKDYSLIDLYKLIAMFLYIGVDEKNISVASMAPGYGHREFTETTKDLLKSGYLKRIPCCAWRPTNTFAITSDGKVWSHYYGVEDENHLLGTIWDSPEEIFKKQEEVTLREAPFMKDEKCLSCEALTSCWGLGCYNIFKYNKTILPSSLCDQEKAIEKHRILTSTTKSIREVIQERESVADHTDNK